MSDEATLLPCPFCGGEAHVVSDYSSEHDETRWNLWHECCEHDGESAGYGHALFPWFETPWYKTEAEAITAWNTRTDYHGYEQAAIEAWKSIKAWNTRATHGTLTAEQVREAIEKRFDFDVWVPAERWQAIADELNAELGSVTCELIDTTSPGNDDYWNSAKCSECGAEFTCAIFGRSSDTPDADYCPSCGRKVVDQ